MAGSGVVARGLGHSNSGYTVHYSTYLNGTRHCTTATSEVLSFWTGKTSITSQFLQIPRSRVPAYTQALIQVNR